jgi:phage terminase large subunit-like protein
VRCHARPSEPIDIAAKGNIFWKDLEKVSDKLDSHGQKIVTTERHYYPFLTYYLCEDAIQSSRNSQYSGWQIAGLLVETPGDETDYGRIRDDIMADLDVFRIREVAHDPWQAPPLMQEIKARDDWDPTIPMVEIKPTVQNFSPAMKELEGAIYGGRFHHNGDPILEWMISNVVCKRDNKDNIYPRKERLENKIDGVIAVIMGVARAMLVEVGGSPYEKRGLLIV